MEARELQQAYYDMLMESQFWSPSQLHAYQRTQIEQLLRHARDNVPFYEHRLDPVFTAAGDVDWDRWHEVPILKRADLVSHKDAMVPAALPPGHGPVGRVQSSGSTGHPVEAIVTRISKLSSDATAWRAGAWQGHDYSQNLVIRNGTETTTVPPKPAVLGPWGPPWDERARTGRSFRVPRWWPALEQIALIERTQSRYLAIGGTKSGYILALEAERRGSPPQLSRILVNGEEVTEEDRTTCRRVFGAEIVDLYSSKEAGHMAHPCPFGGGYHVNSERVLIELLDDHDQPVPVGTSGRVVVTSFYSTGQPLIRYDHGDLATWGQPCTCGRHLPKLASIDGRTATYFRHPDGRAKARGMPMKYVDVLDAQMWQLAQVGALDFEIRYVPRDMGRTGDEATVAAAFREHIFDDARVVFRRLDAIPLTASGKYMEYTNEFGRSGSGHRT